MLVKLVFGLTAHCGVPLLVSAASIPAYPGLDNYGEMRLAQRSLLPQNPGGCRSANRIIRWLVRKC